MLTKLLPIFLLICTIFPSYGEDTKNISGLDSYLRDNNINISYKGTMGLDTAYDSYRGLTVSQSAKIGIKVDVDGKFQIVSFAMNGDHYKSDDTTFPKESLHVRQLYLRSKIGDAYVDAGAMNTSDSGKATGLSNNGWIDGARFTAFLDSGEKIEVVAGHLSAANKVSITDRSDFDFNYYELKVSGRVLEDLLYQVGLRKLDDQNYIRIEGKKTLEVLTGQLVRVLGEAMIDLDNGAVKAGAEVQFEVGKVFNDQSSVISFFSIDYTSDRFGSYKDYVGNEYLTQDTRGTKLELGLKGQIGDNKNLSWTASYAHSLETDNYEVRVGIEWKFGGSRLTR